MKDPQDRDGVELHEGEGLVRTTIVGGQPRKRPAIRMTVKVGLERVLYLAATDRHFRTALLVDRNSALKAVGLSLSEGEAAILDAVGADALAAMIDMVKPRERPQRPFLRSVAATFLTLATGTASIGCDGPVSTGIEPDRDFARDMAGEIGDVPVDDQMSRGIDSYEVEEDVPPPVDLGIEPDVPEIYPDVGSDPGIPDDLPFVTDDLPAPTGIQPDIPVMDADVEEIYPDGGTQPDVMPSDEAPTDIQMDSDAPVVGGILPDLPGAEASRADPATRGGRA